MGVADRGSVEGNFDWMRFEPGLLVSFLPPLPLRNLRTPCIIGFITGDAILLREGDGQRELLDDESIVGMIDFPIWVLERL